MSKKTTLSANKPYTVLERTKNGYVKHSTWGSITLAQGAVDSLKGRGVNACLAEDGTVSSLKSLDKVDLFTLHRQATHAINAGHLGAVVLCPAHWMLQLIACAKKVMKEEE
jgi:hypothetical protein